MDLENQENVVKMEDIIKQTSQTLENKSEESEVKHDDNNEGTSVEKTPKAVKKKAKEKEKLVPKGKPKSGRFWKIEKEKFSSVIKTKGIRINLEKKRTLRESLKRAKEASQAIKTAKQEEKELKKQRRRENLKRQEENRKKSEIVQVIKNTSKIKKMRKKHVRYIEKRDTTNM